jgi:hypothetical protein
MLLPVGLLLADAEFAQRGFLIGAFFALCFPLLPGWSAVFPKLWVLLVVFLFVGRVYLRAIRLKLLVAAVVVAAVLAGVDAHRHAVSYAAEPGQRYQRIATRKDAIFSGAPAISGAGLFYQSIGRDRYVLRWLHDGVDEELEFEGHAFGPEAASADGPIRFELVSRGTSTRMVFDPATRRVRTEDMPKLKSNSASATGIDGDAAGVTSPNGQWIAFARERAGPKQIWLRNAADGKERQLTGGNCNSDSPAWELNSMAIVFASDCGRGIGLPALYRAEIGVGDLP